MGTGRWQHHKLPLGPERLRRPSGVRGAAQTRSLASQAAGVACRGTSKERQCSQHGAAPPLPERAAGG